MTCYRAINETNATTCKQYARNTLPVRSDVHLQAKNNVIGNLSRKPRASQGHIEPIRTGLLKLEMRCPDCSFNFAANGSFVTFRGTTHLICRDRASTRTCFFNPYSYHPVRAYRINTVYLSPSLENNSHLLPIYVLTRVTLLHSPLLISSKPPT